MNKKFTVLVGLLMAVAVTGYSVSGTYAKYTENFNGATSTAKVAKWAITVGDLTSATNGTDQEFTFSLFDTVEDEASTLVDTAIGQKIIAPGTKGNFSIKLRNDSDVKAGYSMTFDVTGAPANLEFSVDNGTTWTKGSINAIGSATTLTALNDGADVDVNVQWRWVFGKDVDDTADASTAAGYKNATVKATVTVSQMGTTGTAA